MTDTHTVGLKIDAAPAKRGATEFSAALDSVKPALRDLERHTASMASSPPDLLIRIEVTLLKQAFLDLLTSPYGNGDFLNLPKGGILWMSFSRIEQSKVDTIAH